MVEYLAGLALVTALLALPIDGNRSVIEMWLAAIRTAFARFLGAISLPL